ncbi:Opioid-binding protein/cell adhesion molecule [Exaiptasia diaphana]|nr:Opioid-binding protein/cell adhesion molecule [Exaiptasia diaphana]
MLSSYRTKEAGTLKMFFLYVSSIVLMFVCPFSSGVARFNLLPENKLYIVQGETAKILWDYHVDDIKTEFNSRSPLWYFHNSSLLIGYGDSFDNRKFKIDTNSCPSRLRTPTVRVSVEGKATLVITNITLKDSGTYGCILFLLSGDLSSMPTSTSQLIVTETPKFTKKPAGSTNITEYKHLSILCVAVGTPLPNVTWKNLSNSMEPAISKGQGSAELKIESITRNYNGQKYRCEAVNNPLEGAIIQETKLIVNYAPEIEKTFEEKSYCINDEAELNCKADGRPQPTLKWTGPSRKGDSSVFKFKIEDEEEFGNYTCVANNSVGSDKYVVRLIKTNVSCQPPVTKPTPSPTDDVHPGIIAGVVIAAILAIAGLIIAIIFWKRRKLLTKGNQSYQRSVRMNAIGDDDNVYATTQQPNREATDRAQPTVQYAAVDKSKKTKKKRPGEGELIYADLDHETPAGERPPSDRRSTGGSGDQPTLYADIGSTRQETPRYGNLQDMDSM